VALAALLSASGASQGVTGDLTLGWDAATDGGLTTAYDVGVGTMSQSYPRIDHVGLVTEYTVAGLTFGTQYYFAVRAVAADGQVSTWSGEVAGIVFHIAQPLTVGLSASAASPQSVGARILWTAQAGGGTPPYTYRWGVQSGTTWTTLTRWTTKATFDWRPRSAGQVLVQVWVRDALTHEATMSVPFLILPRARTVQ
jgi:hypothetical protein